MKPAGSVTAMHQARAPDQAATRPRVAAIVTSNTSLAALPGKVFLLASASGLPRDFVVNVTAIVTLDKADLDQPIDVLPAYLSEDLDRGLRRVLDL